MQNMHTNEKYCTHSKSNRVVKLTLLSIAGDTNLQN